MPNFLRDCKKKIEEYQGVLFWLQHKKDPKIRKVLFPEHVDMDKKDKYALEYDIKILQESLAKLEDAYELAANKALSV